MRSKSYLGCSKSLKNKRWIISLQILNLYVSIVLSNFGTEIFEKSTGAIFSRNMKIKFALWLSKAKTSLCQKQDDVDSRSTRSSMVPDLACK